MDVIYCENSNNSSEHFDSFKDTKQFDVRRQRTIETKIYDLKQHINILIVNANIQ